MGYIRTEEEVDMLIEDMKRKTKGKYITQGVSFNKDSERQMELLKMVLMRSNSFSGFIKELLAKEGLDDEVRIPLRELLSGMGGLHLTDTPSHEPPEDILDVGNFL